jgi:Icc-related predicted phosphoesterase
MGLKKKIVCCTSDIHGNIKDIEIPECDILLIAGDIGRHGRQIYKDANWLGYDFNPWLEKQPAKHIVMTPGNHDIIFQDALKLVPKLSCNVLIDELVEIEGLKIYGSPWQTRFYDWGFNLTEDKLKLVWDKIPADIDILLVHSPPFGIMDMTQHPGYPCKRIGSRSLAERIKVIRPKYVVFGHNHGEPGVIERDGITYINATLVDDSYIVKNPPIMIEV